MIRSVKRIELREMDDSLEDMTEFTLRFWDYDSFGECLKISYDGDDKELSNMDQEQSEIICACKEEL